MKTNNLKKVLSVLLAVMLAMTSLVIVPMTASAAASKGDVITINNASGLANLNASVAAATTDVVYINLNADIDMNGQSYTPVTTAKTIVFDGNNKNISNLSVTVSNGNAALFATAGAGSSFEDLKLTNVTVSGKNAAAVLAVASFGDLMFRNINVVSGSITGTADAAALVATNSHAAANYTSNVTWSVAYCLNGASVTSSSTSGSHAAAGLIAHAVGSVNLQCVYCGNAGTITGANAVGGIVGRTDHGSTKTIADHLIQNCYNKGTLVSTSSSAEMIGGIVAEFRYPAYMVNPMYDSDYVTTLAVTDATILAYLQENYPDYDFSAVTYIPETLANEIKTNVNTACGAKSHEKVLNVNGNGAYRDAFLNWSCLYDTIVRIDSCYDYSVRTLKTASPSYHHGIVGWCGGTEQSISTVSNSLAYCAGTTNNYTKVAHGNLTTASTSKMASSADEVTAKIAEVDAAIAAYTTAVSGVGTKVSPFQIKTADDLKWVVSQSYTYYAELANDIDMKDVDYTPASTMVAVHFDGARHAIQNLEITNDSGDAALYAQVGKNSTFKNLKMEDVSISASGDAAALVAQAIHGDIYFTNVQVSGTVSATKNAGGIFTGKTLNESATNGQMKNVKRGQFIVAHLYLDLCLNTATVTSSAHSAGGLVSGVDDGYAAIELHVSNCGNEGDITTSSTTENRVGVGGLFGYTWHNNGNYVDIHATFENCYSTGKITATSATAVSMGGIVANYRLYGKASNSKVLTDIKVNSVTFTNCFVTSSFETGATRKNTNYNMNSIWGMIANSESTKYVNNSFGVTVTDKTTLLGYGGTIKTDAYSKMVASATETVAMKDGDSTINAEIAKIETAIQNAFTWTPEMTIKEGAGNLSVRIHLRDDFGFMAITEFMDAEGNKMDLDAVDEYYTEYGFIFLQSEKEVTASEVEADGTAVKGSAYQETETTYSETKFCAAYTDVFAADLDVDIYFVAYGKDADGVVKTSEVRSLNLYDLISDGADGTICGQPVTNPAEQALYAEIINYYTKYVAYLDSVATPAA